MYTVYTKENCGYCRRAKDLLEMIGEDFVTHDITVGDTRQLVNEKAGFEIKTVPQIWHGDRYVGGYTELSSYLAD